MDAVVAWPDAFGYVTLCKELGVSWQTVERDWTDEQWNLFILVWRAQKDEERRQMDDAQDGHGGASYSGGDSGRFSVRVKGDALSIVDSMRGAGMASTIEPYPNLTKRN